MTFCQMTPTHFIDSTEFYFGVDTGDEIVALRSTNNVPNTLNIYTTEFLAIETYPDGICGISTLTSQTPPGVVMWNGCFGLPGNPRLGHEVGHFFNLLHTHSSLFGVECTIGFNCGFAGDRICDTPADPGLYIGKNDFWVDGNCEYTGQFAPPCRDDPPYDPDVTNIMAYTPSHCVIGFTTNQRVRMVATLIHKRYGLVQADCGYFGICGAINAGSCPEAHGGLGCFDAGCCSIVCDLDPSCCDTAWDLECALSAQEICDVGPTNNECHNAKMAYNKLFIQFDNFYANADGDPHPECNGQIESDVWFNTQANCTGDLTISTCDSADFDTKIAVYDELGCPLTFFELEGCNDDGAGCAGGTSSITIPVVIDDLLKIRVGGAGLLDEGSGTLHFDCKTQFDDCDTPLVLFHYEGSVNVNTIGASTDGPILCAGERDVWMEYYPAADGILQIDRVADFDIRVALYDNCDCPADNADAIFCDGFSVPVLQDQCYKVQVGGLNGDFGTGQLTFALTPSPSNDLCENAIEVGVGVTEFTNNAALTDGPLHPDLRNCAGDPGDGSIARDIWYRFEALCDATMTVSACNTADFDMRMAVYDGCVCPVTEAELLACNDDARGCGLTSSTSVDVTGGQCYLIRIGGAFGAVGTGEFEISLDPDCQGDANGDGIINILDFLIVLGAWGPCPPPCPPSCPADFDGDCDVGITDFLIVLGNWTL
jgi:hypothetical protein